MIHVSIRGVYLTFGLYLEYLSFNSGALVNPLDPPRGNDLPPVLLFLKFLFNDRCLGAMDLRLGLIRKRRCDKNPAEKPEDQKRCK